MASSVGELANVLVEGFLDQQHRFNQLTLGAGERFRDGDWAAVQQATRLRISQYGDAVSETVNRLQPHLDAHDGDALALWRDLRLRYRDLIALRPDRELAETWFNSVFCRTEGHAAIDANAMFVERSLGDAPVDEGYCVHHTYRSAAGVGALLTRMLREFDLGLPWQDLNRDVRYILDALEPSRRAALALPSQSRIDVLTRVFYRNKGAYLIGRMVTPSGTLPFALPVLRTDDAELYVDTLIIDSDDLSILFSFTRSYFMVDAPVPSAVVSFLRKLLPWKQVAELYNAIGFFKHGKTEFYRAFLDHLRGTDDQFRIAEGTPGMVMIVFVLPSLQTVFKVIRDRFAPSKQVDHATVLNRYELVKKHDRVGRMADTQKFSDLRFPKQRLSPELLDELRREAPSQIVDEGETVRIRLLYSEREMRPLNLYLKEASPAQARAALYDYGVAIRQLAAANIFPGDMLLKNFGVTRHGRVVFYDYDEISYLTDVNFRTIPPPRFPEDELAAEPWYSVGPNDVFPEEFPVFLFSDVRMRREFTQMHGDLFEAETWRRWQRDIEAGIVLDVVPYLHTARFRSTADAAG